MELHSSPLNCCSVRIGGRTQVGRSRPEIPRCPPGGLRGRRDIRPFLRRYYELAIRACNKNELVQVAHYLIESRMDERKGTLDAKATLVLFSFTSKDNFVIFLPQDGRAGKRIALDITRDEIKDAEGKTLHLTDELVTLIRAEWKLAAALKSSGMTR